MELQLHRATANPFHYPSHKFTCTESDAVFSDYKFNSPCSRDLTCYCHYWLDNVCSRTCGQWHSWCDWSYRHSCWGLVCSNSDSRCGNGHWRHCGQDGSCSCWCGLCLADGHWSNTCSRCYKWFNCCAHCWGGGGFNGCSGWNSITWSRRRYHRWSIFWRWKIRLISN